MISLVTTLKNEAATLEDLIAAVRAQTRAPDEFIVVDGGSTDATADLLRASGMCTVIELSGANISAGRNCAIEAAKGEIIVVIDGGCRPAPEWLARLVEPIESGRAEVSAGPTRPIVESPFDAAQWVLLDQFVSPQGLRRPSLSSRSLAFRREVWAGCRYPEWLPIGEDRWLIDTWRAAGRRIETLPDDPAAAVHWRMRPTFATFLRQHFRYMRGDGQAGLRTLTNLARIVFYLILLSLCAFGGSFGVWAALVIWFLYLSATTLVRIALAIAGRSVPFAIRTIFYIPPTLLGMDLVKIMGYLSGWLERLRGQGYS